MSTLPSVGFINLGCAKNLVDSEIIASSLLKQGLTLAPKPEAADVILVNTCSFIRDARRESLEAVLEACHLKKLGQCRAVVVAGCLPQRYKQALREKLPDVDAFIGLDHLKSVGKIIRRLAGGESGIMEISQRACRTFEPDMPRVLFCGGPFAYLKIADGCNHRCSYCAIPAIRGRYRSRTIRNIVKEAEYLLDKGVRELNLVSQDVTAYGCDLKDGTNLPRLLRALGRIGGKFWIRILYAYPTRITDDLMLAMRKIPQVCAYLDVPVQHSHPAILRLMGRAGTVSSVEHLTARIRAALPGAAIRTTCLVGHPGETDGRFQHLLKYVKQSAFDRLGAFAFSPENETKSFDLPHQVSRQVAESRRKRLMLVQKRIVDRNAGVLIGQKAEILLEHCVPGRTLRRITRGAAHVAREGRQPAACCASLEARGAAPVARLAPWIGRSASQAPEIDGNVFVRGVPKNARPGDFIQAEYTAQHGYDMLARAIF